MHAMYRSLLSVLFVVYGASAEPAGFHPRQYIAYRTAGTITVDGKQKAGNVWEICAGTMVIDAKERVVYRGGGWVSPPAQVHASVGVAGVTRCRYIGFRCARDAQ